jgi:hypothetical protein
MSQKYQNLTICQSKNSYQILKFWCIVITMPVADQPPSETTKDSDMSKQHPECPLYNHNNCREFHNPKLCAVIREDKICIKKQKHGGKMKSGIDPAPGHAV